MGTNYYVTIPSGGESLVEGLPRETRHETDVLHVGKSSGGWYFTLRVYPGRVATLEDWLSLLKRLTEIGGHIVDEYGDSHTLPVFTATMTDRTWHPVEHDAQFLAENFARKGRNGLLSHDPEKDGHATGSHPVHPVDYVAAAFS